MQKATPLILVLVLALTATVLSLRSKHDPVLAKVPVVVSHGAPKAEALEKSTAAPAPAVPPVKVTPRPWPQAASDIAPDSAATFGTLDNGFRYIIYPNSEPPKRVSFRLHIASGSLMEADDQQGLAHFIEHMVFNGSKNFKADELVPIMQRMQIAFGADVNAHTGFDGTVYMLDIPDLADDAMKLGFTVMRDYADGAFLESSEIEKERGVILSEKVSRDTVSSRIMEQQFAKLLPDSLLARRFPIGKEDVIKSAQRERFVDFYNRFYTPDRMTFVVVGDINSKEMQAQIEKYFGSMINPATPTKNPELGPIKQPEGIEASVFNDKELSSTEVSLMLVRPFKEKPDTAATRLEDMKLEIAHSIIDRRFERLSKVEGSAIASGSASKEDLFNYVELGSIDITAADDRWKEVVPILEQEFQRAIEYGFTESELAEAKSNILNAYEQQVKQKATRKSEDLASAIAEASNDQSVLSDPVTDLEIAKKNLDSITIANCHEAFKSFWDAPGYGYHLVLTTKEKPENAEKDLAALFEESRGKPVEPPSVRTAQAFEYTNFGKPGTVASRKQIADLGITQLVLSNQVRVNLKPTEFEKGKIRLLARIGSGKLTQPKDKPMLDDFATAVFEGGGLGKHSNDDLQQILAGRNVGSSLTIGEDAFVLSGATTPGDFTIQTQLMCASITGPGYREEALWQFRKAIPMMFQKLKHTPAGPQQEMQAWLYGDDSRFTIAPVEKLSAYTIADAKSWLTPELTKGYLELTIVGDFEIDKIIPDLLSSFGALPARMPAPAVLPAARKIQFPNAPAIKTFTYDSKISQAVALTVWKTAGIRGNQKEFRRFNILAEIYGDRLREEIREKLGASYSPSAYASGSDALDDVGYVMGESVGKPEDLELLLNTMRDLADKFASTGATADELDRALKPTLGQLDKSLRNNNYWLSTVMSQCQTDPKRLELARTRDADYRSINLAEINALAKKYMAARNALMISIKPAAR
ncbi:MAG: insulinase family protein [Luteolibacter sp.]